MEYGESSRADVMVTSPGISRDASWSWRMDRLGSSPLPIAAMAGAVVTAVISMCLQDVSRPVVSSTSPRVWARTRDRPFAHPESAYTVRMAPWHTGCEGVWCSSDRSRAQRHFVPNATLSFGYGAPARCLSLVKRNTLSNGTQTRQTGSFHAASVVGSCTALIAASCHPVGANTFSCHGARLLRRLDDGNVYRLTLRDVGRWRQRSSKGRDV